MKYNTIILVNNNYDDNKREKKLVLNAVSHHLLTSVRPILAALLGNSSQLIVWACFSMVWNIPLDRSPVPAMLLHSFFCAPRH